MKQPFTKAGFFTFMRAQFSSQISSLFDFAVTIFCAKILDIYYVYATSLGSVAGGFLNCFINYYWTFKAQDCKKKYVVMDGNTAAARFAESLSHQKPASGCIPQPARIARKSWYTRNVMKKSTA